MSPVRDRGGDAGGRYEAAWESLQAYTVPAWFMDAKLGIFIHWGAYAVPAFGSEWYPHNMYLENKREHAHHLEKWGPHKDFGYKDFIPMFKGEKWDPAEWVDIFRRAGARYVVPVAEHHDGFPMYATGFTKWNAAEMGPKRDVVADLEKAVRGAGLRFGVSSHRAHNWRYFPFSDDIDTVDPANAGLYGPRHAADEDESDEFLEDWFARTKELVDRFRPDVLWFDFGWHKERFAPYRPRVAAYYYNKAEGWGGEPVLQYKDKFPDGVAVYDIERGKLNDIREGYWQTDTSVSSQSWGYIEKDAFKSVTTVVHDLVDIVSKNGNLLLNVGPRPDGTIPKEQADILLGLGEWLEVNGEAIHGTRCWRRYGEGETRVGEGHHKERLDEPFTAGDVRFTTKDRTLYAVFLGWPGEECVVTSLAKGGYLPEEAISEVTMLGSDGKLEWSQDEKGLSVKTPAGKPCGHAYTLKLSLKESV